MNRFGPLTLAVSLATALATAAPAGDERLVPADRSRRPLAPGDARRHLVAMEAGQFLRVVVHQDGIDVAVGLYAPDGTTIGTSDMAEGPRGWEYGSFLAATAGEYALEVRAVAEARAPGEYAIDSDPPRAAHDLDRKRLAAEAARIDASKGLAGGAATSRIRRPTVEDARASRRELQVAADLFHELREPCFEAEALTLQGLVHGWEQEHDVGLQVHERALGLWKRCGDRYKTAEALAFAAEGYSRAAKYSQAEAAYLEGLATARDLDAPFLRLILLTNLGTLYGSMGETGKSVDCFEQALPMLRALDIPQGEASALRGLALAHFRRGDFQEAADRAKESLALRRRTGDAVGLISTLQTLAEIHLALGDPAAAAGHLDEVLVAHTSGHSGVFPTPTARTFRLLGEAHGQMGDRAAALAAFERGLAVAQRGDEREQEPLSLLALGRFHLSGGGVEEAAEAGGAAVDLLRDAGNRSGLADALELDGAARLALDVPRAQAALVEALDLRKQTQDEPGEAAALNLLARVDRRLGNLDRARDRVEAAVRLVEGTRARILSPSLRSTWLARVRDIHETHVDTLMELHGREPGAAWDVRAFEASESARARSLLDLLAESRAGALRGAAADLLNRERSVRERLTARLDDQVRTLGSGKPPARAEALAAEIRSLSTEYEDVRAHIRAASPRRASLMQPARLSLDEMRSRLLDTDTALLQYFLGTDRSFLWVLDQDSLSSFELPPRATIDEAVRRARHAVAARRAGPELEALSRMLLGPALPRLADRRLLVAADGALHHVPFGALPDAGGRPLVASHEIVTAPSASVLAALRALEGDRPPAPRTLAVLADPVFDRDDARVHARGAAAAAARDPAVARATRAFGFEQGRLPRLPFTRREARSILAFVPAGSRRVALDFAASQRTVEDPDLGRHRIIHFATHGLLNDSRPELSGLVLSLVDEQGRDQPGLLAAPDVYHLELGADLVVLSGCRTAMGREIRGEGVIGLTRAFMYAGVPRVVASLWPVEDLATSELMKRFYEGMLGPRKLRPAAALRRAQVLLAGDPRWSAPYHWAGFQLQGDWR